MCTACLSPSLPSPSQRLSRLRHTRLGLRPPSTCRHLPAPKLPAGDRACGRLCLRLNGPGAPCLPRLLCSEIQFRQVAGDFERFQGKWMLQGVGPSYGSSSGSDAEVSEAHAGQLPPAGPATPPSLHAACADGLERRVWLHSGGPGPSSFTFSFHLHFLVCLLAHAGSALTSSRAARQLGHAAAPLPPHFARGLGSH